MKIAIMQPTFLPWLGYFFMIDSVDTFVLLDNVQFERRSWQSRNKIKLHDKEFFISLSCMKAPRVAPINDIQLDPDKKWREKILNTIFHAYSKSVNFERYYEILNSSLFKYEKLSEFSISLIELFCDDLGIKTPKIKASNLNIPNSKREDLLLEICKIFKANEYISPERSKPYLETDYAKEIFKNNGIDVSYFDFIHPVYPQMGSNFIPYLGIIDFLFNSEFVKDDFTKMTLDNKWGGRSKINF